MATYQFRNGGDIITTVIYLWGEISSSWIEVDKERAYSNESDFPKNELIRYREEIFRLSRE